MDETIEFTIALLRLVAKDLQGFSDEQRKEILAGTAKVRLVTDSKGPKRLERGADQPFRIEDLRSKLESSQSRDEARAILNALGASKTTLQKLSRQLDLPVPRDDTVDMLIERIVESVVGFKLRSLAIQGKGEPVARHSDPNEQPRTNGNENP